MTAPNPTQPDRQPHYLRVEAARLGAALDQAKALLDAKGFTYSTSDCVIVAAALIEMRRASRLAQPTPPEEPH
jgi:hypothetical protein